MSGNVHQSDKDKLKATVDVAADQAIEVTQADAAKLKATVTQAAKDRTVTGSVTAVQTVGANLKVEASQDPFVSFAVDQANAALLKATVTQAAKDRTVTNDTAAALKATVWQDAKDRTVTNATAANLKAEVSQGTAASLKATVTPSGDMARKAYYDRNSSLVVQKYTTSSVGSHANTDRWTYTVPADRKALHSVLHGSIDVDVATADKWLTVRWHAMEFGGEWSRFAAVVHTKADGLSSTMTVTATFALNEGDAIKLVTFSDDTVNHGMRGTSLFTEFDE